MHQKYLKTLLSNRNKRIWPILLLVFLWIGQTIAVSDTAFAPVDSPLKNGKGEKITLGSLKGNQDILILIFVSSKCPVTNLYWDRIKGIWYNHREHGVVMYAVGGNSDDSPVQIHSVIKDRDLLLPLVWDEGHSLAKTLGVQFTPTALVIGKNWEIFYRGPIDDSWRDETRVQKHYLDEAIHAVLHGDKKPDSIEELLIGSSLR